MFLVSEVLVQFGIEGGFNSHFDQLLSKSSEIFFRLNVFGQLGGHGFEFLLVQLHTHDGILLKRLLSRGQLHNLVYRLGRFASYKHMTFRFYTRIGIQCTERKTLDIRGVIKLSKNTGATV